MRVILFLFTLLIPYSAICQELIVPSGHLGKEPHYRFSEDEEYMVSWLGNADRVIKLWETATNREIKNFVGGKKGIQDVLVVPDLKQIFSIDGENTLLVWDMETGDIIKSMPTEMWKNHLDIDSSHTELRIYSDKAVTIYDINTLIAKQQTILRWDAFSWLHASPSFLKLKGNKTLIPYSDSAFIITKEGKLASKFELSKAHMSDNEVVGIDETNNQIIIVNRSDKTVSAINLKDYKKTWNVHLENYPYLSSMCGNNKVLINDGSNCILINLLTGQSTNIDSIFSKEMHYGEKYSNKQFIIDAYITSNNNDDKVYKIDVYNANTLKKISEQIVPYGNTDYGGTSLLTDKHFVSTSENSPVGVLSTYSSPYIYDLGYHHFNGTHTNPKYAISDAHTRFMAKPANGVQLLLDKRTFQGYTYQNPNCSYLFSADFKYTFENILTRDKILYKLSLLSKDSLALIEVHNYGFKFKDFNYYSFSDDGNYLAFVVDSTLTIANTFNGNIIEQRHLKRVYNMIFGKFMAYLSNSHFMYSQGDSILNYYSFNEKSWDAIKLKDKIISVSSIDKNTYIISTKSHILQLSTDNKKTKGIIDQTGIYMIKADPETSTVYLFMQDGSLRIINYSTNTVDKISNPNLNINFGADWIKANVFSKMNSHLIISEDRKYILCHGKDNIVRIWDKNKKELVFSTPILPYIMEIEFRDDLLILLANGKYIEKSNSVWVYNWKENKLLFNDSTEAEKQIKNPPKDIESLVKTPLSKIYYHGDRPPETKQVNRLRYSAEVSLDHKKENILVSYENIACHV